MIEENEMPSLHEKIRGLADVLDRIARGMSTKEDAFFIADLLELLIRQNSALLALIKTDHPH